MTFIEQVAELLRQKPFGEWFDINLETKKDVYRMQVALHQANKRMGAECDIITRSNDLTISACKVPKRETLSNERGAAARNEKNRETVEHLKKHGPIGSTRLAEILDEKPKTIQYRLRNARKAGLVKKERRLWSAINVEGMK